MKIVFVSNFLTHHQQPFVDALNAIEDVSCLFVETRAMPEHRKKLGYREEKPDYVMPLDELRSRIDEVIGGCDVLISGGIYPEPIRLAKRYKKPVFVFSERLFKDATRGGKNAVRAIKYRRYAPMLRKAYLLCAGGYAYADYHALGLFRGRAYSWGYFPAFREYPAEKTMQEKNRREILWCARFLTWKRYEDILKAASLLKTEGVDFTLSLIGIGEMLDDAKRLSTEYRLEDKVRFLGSMPTEEVREHMERAGVFALTSDRQEGWGAVLNEAMNSKCAVIVSDAAGAAPTLVRHRENGLIYPACNVQALSEALRQLLDDPDEQRRLGENAYQTIAHQWNPDNAARRLVRLFEAVVSGEEAPAPFDSGVCAKAKLIKDGWFSG